MSKLQPAPLAFPNGGALAAVAKKKKFISDAEQQRIALDTKIALGKAKTPEEKERVRLNAQLASTKVGKK